MKQHTTLSIIFVCSIFAFFSSFAFAKEGDADFILNNHSNKTVLISCAPYLRHSSTHKIKPGMSKLFYKAKGNFFSYASGHSASCTITGDALANNEWIEISFYILKSKKTAKIKIYALGPRTFNVIGDISRVGISDHYGMIVG